MRETSGTIVGVIAPLAIPLALALALIIAATPGLASGQCTNCPESQGGLGYGGQGGTISLGSGSLLPGVESILIPIYVSTPEEATSWQMGLDYEDILAITDISIDGTVSAELAPDIHFLPGAAGEFLQLRMHYFGGALPAGEELLVGHLVVSRVADVPLDMTTEFPITITGDDRFPVLVGDNMPTSTIDGAVTIYAGTTVRVSDAESDFFQSIDLPVWLWNDGSGDGATTLQMGLDYEDVLLNEIDLSRGLLRGIEPSGYSLEIESTAGGSLIRLELFNGHSLPAGDGIHLFDLRFKAAAPMEGLVSIEIVEATLDDSSIDNLLSGSILFLEHYISGDVNMDRTHRVNDAILVLQYMFKNDGTLRVPCPAAADVNGDAVLSIADGLHLLNYLFASGAQPAAPFPDPGPRPVGSTIPCLD